MAGLALKSEFYDDYGIPCQILIYDKDLSSGFGVQWAHTIKGSIVLSDEGDDNNPFKRIIPKKLTWTILMYSPDYTELQREAALDLYTGLTTSPEGRYYVIMKSDSIVLFRGKVLADVGDLVLNYHKDLSLKATDGLVQLKDIDYRPTDYDDQVPEELIKVSPFVEHFKEILKRNDVVDFFYNDALFAGTTQALFTTSTNWETTSAATLTGDIMKYVSKRNTYFKQEEGKLYREYGNCWDALTDLITGFNARMIFSDGAYHIEALGYQDNLTLVRYAYDYTGTATTSPGNKTTHDITTDDDIYILADPALKYIAPFKAVSLRQNKKYNNILAGLDAWYNSIALPDNRGPHNLGYVIGAGKELVFDLRFEHIFDPNDFTFVTVEPGYIQWELSMQIGDYYLANNPNNNNVLVRDGNGNWQTYIPKEFLWTLVPSTFVVLRENNGFVNIPWALDSITIIKGLSDEIVEDGDFILTMVSWKYLDLNLDEVSAATANLEQWTIAKSSRILIVTNSLAGLIKVPDNTIIYEIGDVKNSIVYEETLTYHDTDPGGVAGFNSLLLVIPSGPSTIYELTTEWTDDDMGVTLPIQELLIKQMLGMRKIPNKVVRLTMQRSDDTIMHMDDRYALGDTLYIPLKSVHNVDSGTYTMSLWAPVKDYDGDNIIRFTDDTPKYEYTGTDVLLTRTSTAGYRRMWRFDGVTDTYVTLPENLAFYIGGSATPEEIETYFDVYRNGVYLFYKDYEALTFPLTGGELTMGEYTVYPDDNTFHFAFNEDDIILIKYIKL